MAGQTNDQPITTREARKRLAVRAEPYWRAIDAGAAIGYRKGATSGFWIARVLIENRYRKESIARTDDGIRADGVTFLDYRQAEAKVRVWASRQHAGDDAGERSRAPYTVENAIADYLADMTSRGAKSVPQTRQIANAHILLPSLGATRVDRLTRQRVKTWLDALSNAAPRLRTSKRATEPRRREIDPNDHDAMRARRATANRVLTVLKAALNHARHAGKVTCDDTWSLVKPFKQVGAPRIRHLDDAESTRLVNACPADVRQIVTAALLTGMRYGEIIGMKAADFHVNDGAGTVSLSTSKSGKARLIHLTDEGVEFFTQATAGKASAVRVFLRSDGEPWGKSHQFRPLREACAAAKIAPAIGFHILRHTYASRLVMAGVPMAVVAAQIGDSEAITAKHYAHLAPSYVGDTVRKHFTALGIVPPSNVTPLQPRQASA
jgi:integrase